MEHQAEKEPTSSTPEATIDIVDDERFDLTYKIILIGNSSVGKSEFVGVNFMKAPFILILIPIKLLNHKHYFYILGKSGIFTRYTRSEFNIENVPTIGVEFSSKIIKHDEKLIRVQLVIFLVLLYFNLAYSVNNIPVSLIRFFFLNLKNSMI